MSSVNYAIAMTSVCDSKENVERLINALIDIDAKLEIQKFKKYKIELIYTLAWSRKQNKRQRLIPPPLNA